jgi:SAM-dependent methyltransferase
MEHQCAATAAIAEYWDAAAASFDAEPDHGLAAARTRGAWARRLECWIPDGPVDVLDVGCGTGSLAVLLARAGHRVTGVDLAARMVERARAKAAAAGVEARFTVGDAATPPTGERRFDVVLARHLLWTLPDPEAALRAWVARLRPGGRLVLVEGRWQQPDGGGNGNSGEEDGGAGGGAGSGGGYVAGAEALPWSGGVAAEALVAAVAPLVAGVRVEPLADDPDLWGRQVDDERYALLATL